MEKLAPTITDHFAILDDPRIVGKTRHLLLEIIVIAVCGVTAGANGWEQIQEFGEAKKDWFSRFLSLPHGIPSDDTFRRVISRLNTTQFQKCFVNWVQSVAKVVKGELIAIDGKTLRRSYDSGSEKAAIHMVSAWAVKNHVVLGQIKTSEKSNEITAIPELLKLLEIKGCIVSIDAMGCQKKIAAQIVDQGADYVLGLKGNQGNFLKAVEKILGHADAETLSDDEKFDFYQTTEKNRGRIEIRSHFTTSAEDLPMASKWKGLKTVGMVISEREENGKKSTECRYYISSLNNDAELFAKSIRSHWRVENSLHYVLDVTFREDECRIRKEAAPENFAVLRHIARNLLQQEKSKKSIKKKTLRAGWDNKFLEKVLFGNGDL